MKNIIFTLIAIIAIGLILSDRPAEVEAGVPIANEYQATTTVVSGGISSIKTIVSGRGVFGSVVVTEAGAAGGYHNFYDATTTNVNLRTGQAATTTILKASIPNNATVGTYTFDVALVSGLLYVFDGTGAKATTTITFREY